MSLALVRILRSMHRDPRLHPPLRAKGVNEAARLLEGSC